MFAKYVIASGFALGLGISSAAAQSCGGVYSVKPGDTLSQISDELYKDARKWSAIYGGNLNVIGENPNALRVGQKLNLSCIGGLPLGLEGGATVVETPTVSETVDEKAVIATETSNKQLHSVKLITAGDYAPFTAPELENGGLFTNVVTSTFNNSTVANDYKIYWVNDWAAHLDPLLKDHVMDLGFPWYKPDCEATPDNFRCENFYFAKPMFETLILLFTNKSKPMAFTKDDDVIGKTLCRPNGYFTHDLDRGERKWLSEGKIKLEQPTAMADCFEMLMDGKVDGVAINEFTGRAAIKKLGLVDKVSVVATRPISIEGLHIVVHKNHPQAKELISMVNSNLSDIKESGEYQKIIDTHMSKIWEDF